MAGNPVKKERGDTQDPMTNSRLQSQQGRKRLRPPTKHNNNEETQIPDTLERQIEEFLDEDDDKENILRRIKPIRRRNGRTQEEEETDYGDCISNQQKWKRRKLIEINKRDEEHHIPDTLEQQIEKWMGGNKHIILNETTMKRSSKDNATHATHTKKPEEQKEKNPSEQAELPKYQKAATANQRNQPTRKLPKK